MRHKGGARKAVAGNGSRRRRPEEEWSDCDYLIAAPYVALMIAPIPFFWAPPLWVLWALACPSETRPSGGADQATRAEAEQPLESVSLQVQRSTA